MSITYGATGGTSDYTVKLAEEVRNNNIPALAHLTCASSTKEKVASVIEELKAANIENILALRGDIPANADFPLPDQYKHASELIADIKARTGLKIIRVEVGYIDFLRDAAMLKIYYEPMANEINTIDTLTKIPRGNE